MCDKFERSQHQSNTQPTMDQASQPGNDRPTEPTDPVDLWGSNVQCNCLVAVKNGPAINMRFQLNLRPATHDAHFWTLTLLFSRAILLNLIIAFAGIISAFQWPWCGRLMMVLS